MTPDQHRQHAEKIIRSHAGNVETLSIWEMLEDANPTDDVDAIRALIDSAQITIGWTTPGLTRVVVNLIPAALDAVNRAGYRSGDTSTEVINRAVQLYNAVTALTPGDAIQYDDHGRQITICRAATEPTDDR